MEDKKIDSIIKSALFGACENSSTNNQNANEEIRTQNGFLSTILYGASSYINDLNTKVANIKDILKFNIISLSKQIDYNSVKKIHIFSTLFDLNNETQKCNFMKTVSDITYFSYRKNFPKIENVKNNSFYTSDCGWGCMIRSSQMIFCRAIYKVLQKNYTGKLDKRVASLLLFFDSPIKVKNVDDCFVNYIATLTITNKDFKFVYPPFSIKNICKLGEIYQKTSGEWFSDVYMPNIFKLINKHFNVFPSLTISSFQSVIILSTLLSEGFQEITLYDKLLLKENQYFSYNEKFYKLKGETLIFVSVRLGIQKVAEEYYNSIKETFNCRECLGFIGGKENSAFYFIGYDNDNIFYLDPHFSQETVHDVNDTQSIVDTYFNNKTLYQLPFDRLQTGLTIGFLIRDMLEFYDWYNWIMKFSKLEFPCFNFQFEDRSSKLIQNRKNCYMSSQSNDF